MAQPDTRVVSIVDDDASLRRSLRNLLTSVGFRVETFPRSRAPEFLSSFSLLTATTKRASELWRPARSRSSESRSGPIPCSMP